MQRKSQDEWKIPVSSSFTWQSLAISSYSSLRISCILAFFHSTPIQVDYNFPHFLHDHISYYLNFPNNTPLKSKDFQLLVFGMAVIVIWKIIWHNIPERFALEWLYSIDKHINFYKLMELLFIVWLYMWASERKASIGMS